MRHWFRKRLNECQFICCLLIVTVKFSKSACPVLFGGSINMYVGKYSTVFIYCMYLLVPGSMTREIWVVLGQGPIHHLCQCWASRIMTATSTCSWALSIASVEDCRWLSDRTSSAPAQWTSQHFEREGRRQHRAQRPWRKLAVSCLVVSVYLSFKAS